jgi:hypothetical protein
MNDKKYFDTFLKGMFVCSLFKVLEMNLFYQKSQYLRRLKSEHSNMILQLLELKNSTNGRGLFN